MTAGPVVEASPVSEPDRLLAAARAAASALAAAETDGERLAAAERLRAVYVALDAAATGGRLPTAWTPDGPATPGGFEDDWLSGLVKTGRHDHGRRARS